MKRRYCPSVLKDQLSCSPWICHPIHSEKNLSVCQRNIGYNGLLLLSASSRTNLPLKLLGIDVTGIQSEYVASDCIGLPCIHFRLTLVCSLLDQSSCRLTCRSALEFAVPALWCDQDGLRYTGARISVISAEYRMPDTFFVVLNIRLLELISSASKPGTHARWSGGFPFFPPLYPAPCRNAGNRSADCTIFHENM